MIETATAEKPPVYPNSLPLPHPSSPLKRRKVGRSTPVPKRQTNSPTRLSSLRKRNVRYIAESSESNSEDECSKLSDDTPTVEKTGSAFMNGDYGPLNNYTPIIDTERHQFRRHTEAPVSFHAQNQCSCKTEERDTSCPSCNRRHTTDASANEMMKHETKLVVLEYLSSLTPEKLTARYKTSRRSSIASRSSSRASQISYIGHGDQYQMDIFPLKEEEVIEAQSAKGDEQKRKASVKPSGQKSQTVTIGEHERKELMAQLAAHAKEQAKQDGKPLQRSSSDISAEHWATVRKKLDQMKAPVREWIDCNVKPGATATSVSRSHTWEKQASRPLSLLIPRRTSPVLSEASYPTPETFAVNKLEEMSIDIMQDFPNLLSEEIAQLLRPLKDDKMISYDSFANVARSVYNTKLSRVSGTVWTRIGLVLYTVKETIFSGNLNDTQLELLVEYSTKFITEYSKESVEKEGGWDALGLEESMFNGLPLCQVSTDEDSYDEQTILKKISRQELTNNYTATEKIKQTVKEWTPYGMAAVAVGLGLAYSYMKC